MKPAAQVAPLAPPTGDLLHVDRAADLPTAESVNDGRRFPGWASLAVRIAATSALIWIVLRNIDWPELGRVFRSLDGRWLLAGMLAAVIAHSLAGVRWAGLARPIGFDFSTFSFVRRFFEGVFFSLCLPTSIGGDVVKAYRLAPTSSGRLLAACTVLADRLTGLSALAVLAATTLLAYQFDFGLPAAVLLAIVLMGGVTLSLIVSVGSLDWLLSRVPVLHAARSFISKLLPYQQRPGLLARAVAWSMLIQVGFVCCVMLMARGMALPVPTQAWFYAVPLVSLATVLPISISGVGIREVGFVHLLAEYGVTEEQAVALGMLWFMAQVGNGMLGGVSFLLDRSR
jgi:uncharacterized membrane protein YbhN (UPF0104 family)